MIITNHWKVLSQRLADVKREAIEMLLLAVLLPAAMLAFTLAWVILAVSDLFLNYNSLMLFYFNF